MYNFNQYYKYKKFSIIKMFSRTHFVFSIHFPFLKTIFNILKNLKYQLTIFIFLKKYYIINFIWLKIQLGFNGKHFWCLNKIRVHSTNYKGISEQRRAHKKYSSMGRNFYILSHFPFSL
jgi:hypothetical protein